MARKSPLKSRKLWMSVAGVCFVIITEVLGIEISEEAYWTIIGVIISYILGESVIDMRK